MAVINYNELAVQQVFSIDAFTLDTGALLARLTHLKTSSWANNGTIVYAQGGVGNPKIIGFGHSKTSTLTTTSATISDGSWGMVTGSGVNKIANGVGPQYSEVITATTADTVNTTYIATGTVGSEIGFAYVLNEYGGVTSTYTQTTATAAAQTFAYASATKTLTFATGTLPVGSKVLVFYYPTIVSANYITNRTDKFAMNVKVVANTIFVDTCTALQYAGQLVFYKAKVGEETTFDLSADGDPAVQNLTFEALQSCLSPKLWDIYLYSTDSTNFATA